MEKNEQLTKAIENIKKELRESKFGSNHAPVSFNKDDIITGAKLARENGLDKDDVKNTLLNLYKSKTSITVNSNKKLVVFYKKDRRTIYLHPLAQEIIIRNLSKQKD